MSSLHSKSKTMLRPLGSSDVPALQRLLDATPEYHRRVYGGVAADGAADELLKALPPGRTLQHKLVLGLEDSGELLACVELIRGYPTGVYAFLGLLLIREDRHGQGLGRSVYGAAENFVRALWPELEKLRLAVALSNDVAGFWSQMGFVDTGERKQDLEHGIDVLLMEKAFHTAEPR
jgi:predicted GNAT family N-acyltransferase